MAAAGSGPDVTDRTTRLSSLAGPPARLRILWALGCRLRPHTTRDTRCAWAVGAEDPCTLLHAHAARQASHGIDTTDPSRPYFFDKCRHASSMSQVSSMWEGRGRGERQGTDPCEKRWQGTWVPCQDMVRHTCSVCWVAVLTARTVFALLQGCQLAGHFLFFFCQLPVLTSCRAMANKIQSRIP